MLSDQLQLRHYDAKGDGFEYGGQNKNSSFESNIQREDNNRLTIDEIDSAKFALFCKWLNESNFQTKSHDVKDVISSESIDKDSSDDDFVDSNNEIDYQFKETLPLVIEQANMSSTIHEIHQTKDTHPTAVGEVHAISQVEPKKKRELVKPATVNEDHVYETLIKMPSQTNLLDVPNQSLLSLNLSCASSASDLTSENGSPRRPASHNKGRAPPVPSSVTQSISDDKITETAPLSLEKDKKKKNLLTYIPAIFKPITPSNSSKNLTKETEI